jgi:hypothetical protein
MIARGANRERRALLATTSQVITGERQRLTQLLERALNPTVERQLDALLEAEEGMYRIRTLKHEPRSFSYQEMRREVERRGFFEPLYGFA